MKQVFPNKKHHILKNFTHTCEMLSGVVTAAGNKRIKEALGKPDVRCDKGGRRHLGNKMSDVISQIRFYALNRI